MRYAIGYLDMYDYGTSWSGPQFASVDEAREHAKAVLDDFLQGALVTGMTAAQLYEHFMTFGEDVVIASLDGAPKVAFSGQEYVRLRSEELCGPAKRATPPTSGAAEAADASAPVVDCLTLPGGDRLTRERILKARASIGPIRRWVPKPPDADEA